MLLDRFWCAIGLCGTGPKNANIGAELAGTDMAAAHILTTTPPNFDLPLVTPKSPPQVSADLLATAVITGSCMKVGEIGRPRETGFITIERTEVSERTGGMLLRRS